LSHDLDRGFAENKYNVPSVPGFPPQPLAAQEGFLTPFS